MLLKELHDKNLINPPGFVLSNTVYLSISGSLAYGTAQDYSDFDVVGFCIPPKDLIFPHLAGQIDGFGRQIKKFEQYQQHGIVDPTAMNGKGREYDITVFSIIKFFQLCMDGNPNCLETIFTPIDCVLHNSVIGNLVRENRKLFLHKGFFPRAKGYAFAQISRARSQTRIGKRKELVDKYNFDIKCCAHAVRLLGEAEQVLVEHDLDLRKNKEQVKSVRNGEWTFEQVNEYFTTKERELETLYLTSTLRHSPDEEKIKELLLNCLEMHYGSLNKCVKIEGRSDSILREIKRLIDSMESTQ